MSQLPTSEVQYEILNVAIIARSLTNAFEPESSLQKWHAWTKAPALRFKVYAMGRRGCRG